MVEVDVNGGDTDLNGYKLAISFKTVLLEIQATRHIRIMVLVNYGEAG